MQQLKRGTANTIPNLLRRPQLPLLNIEITVDDSKTKRIEGFDCGDEGCCDTGRNRSSVPDAQKESLRCTTTLQRLAQSVRLDLITELDLNEWNASENDMQ